jgi:hypothetical protein
MSIVPMNQGKDLFSPEQFRNDLNKSKQYAKQAIDRGVAGALNMTEIAFVPGQDSYMLGAKGYPDSNWETALARILDKTIGRGNNVGTQVYSDDQSGNPNGVAVPKSENTVDAKGV